LTKKKTASEKPAATRPRNHKVKVDGHRGYYTSYGYRAARVANREGRTATTGAGARHLQYDRVKLVNQSREFMRDNAIYKGMINRAAAYIVGPGFKLQMLTEDKDLNDKVEQLWKEFWLDPGVRGFLSGFQIQKLVCRELLVAGDTAVLKVKDGKLQTIEAEQITSGRRTGGINLGKYGNITSFDICPYRAGGFVDTGKRKNVKAKDVFFLSNPDRPSSTRSAPPSQASFTMLHRINDVCDSEAIAWQMLARFAVAITQKDSAEQAYLTSREDPNKSGDDTDGDLATRLHELDYALIFHGEQGEEIKGIERNIPAKNFTETLRTFLRLLGLPLGLPLELILLDWTQSNYSQSRAVMEQAYQMFLEWQMLLETGFLERAYKWKLAQWIADGSLGQHEGVLKHGWIKPTFPWIDQLKEAQAYGVRLDRGLATHAQVLKTLNQDRDEVVAAREAEIRDAIERAQRIEAKTGEKVPYQIFCGLKPPKTEPGRPGGSEPAAVDKETKE